MFNFFGKDIGVDIGTTMTRVYVKGEGVVIEEPTYVMVDKKTKEVLSIGYEAQQVDGRENEDVEIIRPIRGRKVENLKYLQHFIREILYFAIGSSFFRPRVLLAITPGTTSVQRKALEDTLIDSGAASVSTESVPILAALGNGIPFEETTGRTIVVLGARLVNVSILSSGGIVSTHTADTGGDMLNKAIIKHIKERHNIDVGEQTVEKVKRDIGSALYLDSNPKTDLEVMSDKTKITETVTIRANEITDAMLPELNSIADHISRSIHNIPPQITGDIVENGVLLCGGTANLNYIKDFFEYMLGVPVEISKSPETCIILGTGGVLGSMREERNIHTIKKT